MESKETLDLKRKLRIVTLNFYILTSITFAFVMLSALILIGVLFFIYDGKLIF